MAKKPKILVYIKKDAGVPTTLRAASHLHGQLKPAIAYLDNQLWLLIPDPAGPNRGKYGHCWAIAREDCIICEGNISSLPRHIR